MSAPYVRILLVASALALGLAAASPPGRAAADTAGRDASLLPFPVDPSTMAHVHGYIGQSCDVLSSPQPDIWSGFSPIKGFSPIVAGGDTVRPMMKDQSRFAFLVSGSGSACRINDVVVLPDPQTANVFEECDASGSGSPDGIAMRALGERKLVAYWTIDPRDHRFVRRPAESRGKLRCREPDATD